MEAKTYTEDRKMDIIRTNGDSSLYNTLHHCAQHNPTYRCLHIKQSQIDHADFALEDDWFDQWVLLLKDYFVGHSCKIFKTHDQDIFIVTNFMNQTTLPRFLERMPSAFRTIDLKRFLSLYEIGIDWPTLRRICEIKIKNLKAATQTKQKNTHEIIKKITDEEALKTIDRDLLSSLSMRRDARKNIEVMIVEDDLFSQRLLQTSLKQKYSLSMTVDGQGAILNYVKKAPDIVFLDIELPDTTGHEVLKKLLALDPAAHIVMFSGNGDKPNIMKAIELGAKGFVGKPFSQDKVIHSVEHSPHVLAKRKKEISHGH